MRKEKSEAQTSSKGGGQEKRGKGRGGK